MNTLWLERPLMEQFRHLLTDDIALSGPGAGGSFETLAEAHGIIASSLTYDAALMDLAPKLKVISRTGIGYDNVDVVAATERGIAVCNTPDGPTISTAEHGLMLILAVAKRLNECQQRLRAGEGVIYPSHHGLELFGKVLGLVGFGRIARRVAMAAQALGMTVSAYDPWVATQQIVTAEVQAVSSLAELLGTADVVSLHLPLTEETRKLMNAERFAQMKPGAIFVNASRGGLVDEVALTDALSSGKLFGAGLDVTDPEPPLLDNPLLSYPNVIITPHIASATVVGKARIYETALSQALQVIHGERPEHLINPEVWEKRR